VYGGVPSRLLRSWGQSCICRRGGGEREEWGCSGPRQPPRSEQTSSPGAGKPGDARLRRRSPGCLPRGCLPQDALPGSVGSCALWHPRRPEGFRVDERPSGTSLFFNQLKIILGKNPFTGKFASLLPPAAGRSLLGVCDPSELLRGPAESQANPPLPPPRLCFASPGGPGTAQQPARGSGELALAAVSSAFFISSPQTP